MANNSVTFTIRVTDGGTLKEIQVNANDVRDAMQGMGGAATGAGNALSKLGGKLAGLVSVGAVVGVLKNAVRTIADFERANSELASVLGTTADGVQVLSESAAQLGRTTEFTASEVTALQTALARLGFTGGQITDMQESVLKFAAAVGTDLGSAADFAGSALRAFGLKASDSQALLDIMAASTSKSALSFSKLQESISTVGPVANAFGLKAGEVTALLGVLSNAGFDASSAATALRNILLNLADSNGKLGTGLGHTAKTMPEIIAALKELQTKGVDLNSTLEMTDKRSVAAFAALVAGADDVDLLNTQLQNADGSLNQMYETMTDNVIGAVKGLQSAWEGFVLKVKESKGPLKDALNFVADTINAYTDLIESGQTGGKSHRQKKDQNELLERFKYIGREQGRDEMLRQYNQWLKDAEAEYDRAIDRFNAYKSIKNRRAMNEAGNYVMNLTDISSQLRNFGLDSVADDEDDEDEDEDEEITDGISKDIDKYRQMVERAVQINQAFAGEKSDLTVQLDTMKSGITSLIAKYGDESDAVQELIKEYRDLYAAKLGMDTPLEKIDNPDLTLKLGKDTTLNKPSKAVKSFADDVSNLDSGISTIESLAGAFGSLGQVVSGSAGSWAEWIANLLRAVAQAVPAINILTEAIGAKTAAEVADSVAGGASAVAPIPVVGPGLAVAAGATILASLLSVISSIPKFADGGIAFGPTLGIFGEYAGAANNPEVVAPLSSLKNLIFDGTGSAGIPEVVELRARGTDLVGVIDLTHRRRSRG